MTVAGDGVSPEQLEAWDDKYVWHPFTPHSVYRSEEPLMIVAGEGNYLIDARGERYLDGVSSIWCNTFGHRRPEIDAAVTAQLGRIAHATFLGNASAPGVVLAKRLVEVTPSNLTRVFYSDNGSTSVEIALKMALQYWQLRGQPKRKRFVGLGNAYNGDTVGAVAVGGIDAFHERFRPLLFDVLRAPSPYAYRCDLCAGHDACIGGCYDALEATLKARRNEIAAVVLEPGFQGAGGIITLPEGYVRKVREITSRLGILLILDEVAVGMGRSGKMFACEREGVQPDFLCIAKGLTGGYLPLAATLATEEIFDAFLGAPEEGRTFFHGHTYTGNALGCAAALATLDIFEKERVIDGLPAKIAALRAALRPLAGHPNVGEVRQYGLAAGVELVADRATRAAHPASGRVGMKVCRAARDKGVFLRPLGDTIVLMPPLSISEDEIGLLGAAVQHGIRSVLG
jgi:adenosylmethionine---8-amino-7-oxononanoate aminotransferase